MVTCDNESCNGTVTWNQDLKEFVCDKCGALYRD